MKNKMQHLNDHLFEQLERLNDEDTHGEKLAEEIKRADAIAGISTQIIATADLRIKAAKLYGDHAYGEHGASIKQMLPEIGAPIKSPEVGKT